MLLLWPAGLCFLALQVCNICEEDAERSGTVPLFNGTNVNVPVATISGTYGECGPGLAKGLYVRIDDPKFIEYVKKVSQQADLIADDKTSRCPAQNGKSCMFPFTYEGITQETCLSDRTCPTSFDERGQGTEFAGCTEACPFEPQTFAPVDSNQATTFDPETQEEFTADVEVTENVDDQETESSLNPEDFVDVNFDPETVGNNDLVEPAAVLLPPPPPVQSVDFFTTTERVSDISDERKSIDAGKRVTCIYTCRARGSCTVRIQTFGRGASLDGNVQGFCFSPTFGGRCSGIPKGCQSCGDLCQNRAGQQFSVEGSALQVSGEKHEMKIIPLVAGEKSQCLYSCKENRGCSVELVSNVLTSGSIKGSCFPPSFGGTCSGIPDSCSRCLDVCQNRAGEEFMLPVQELGETALSDAADEILISTLTVPKRTDSCVYSCNINGVCSVDVISDSFITGNVRGSCFPPAFGGRCNGIPKGCQPCLNICKLQPGGRFIVPIGVDANIVAPIGVSVVDTDGPENVKCSYKCQPTGSCSVRIIASNGHFEGNSLGSCFSKAFGGACSGTPDRCDDCLTVCERRNEKEFQIPAKNI